MKNIISSILFLAVLTACTDSTSRAQVQDLNASASPIDIHYLQQNGVYGLLGYKLGTLLQIEGEVVEHAAPTKRLSAIKYWLRVDKVNGVELEKAQLFPFQKHAFSKLPEAFAFGYAFKFAAYESGAFTGIIEGEFNYTDPYAGIGYTFLNELLILGVFKD